MDIKDELKLIRVLWNDVELSINELNEVLDANQNIEYKARSYIRAYASWVEGGIFLFKKMFSQAQGGLHNKLPIESQLYLFDYDWKISNGLPKLESKRISTRDNIKAFFKVISQIFEGYDPALSDNGWNELMYFFQIRDGIMHPKNNSDLELSKEDLMRCEKGRDWMKNELSKITDALKKYYEIA